MVRKQAKEEEEEGSGNANYYIKSDLLHVLSKKQCL